jgi:membrane protein YqaA with SNARE-associated domain
METDNVKEKGIAGKIKKWVIENAKKPIAERILYFVSFVDSFISPMPPDPFLAVLTVINPKRWLRYAFYTMLFGVIGGLVGYVIGFALFEYVGEQLVALYNFQEGLQKMGEAFSNHAFLSILIAAFTPIPYQIFTVAAGLFRINLIVFIIASILGRGARFFIVALLMRFIGEHCAKLVLKYLNWILLLLGIVVLSILYLF